MNGSEGSECDFCSAVDEQREKECTEGIVDAVVCVCVE